jgi:hypothetical protein
MSNQRIFIWRMLLEILAEIPKPILHPQKRLGTLHRHFPQERLPVASRSNSGIGIEKFRQLGK